MPTGVPSRTQREREKYPCACRCKSCPSMVYRRGKVCQRCDLILRHTDFDWRPS